MPRHALRSYASIVLVLLIASAIGWAGSQGGVLVDVPSLVEVPLFAVCGAFAFIVNWIVFIPANLFQTERYFDLTGSLTYLSIISIVFVVRGAENSTALLVGTLVAIWAVRLGSFLFVRVTADGSDGRFDRIKPNFPLFLMTWTIQGLWVFLTLSCGLAAMTSNTEAPLGVAAAVGTALWVFGFVLECTADFQKRAFRKDPANDGRFITTGLWAWSRHPNYFGEICLWIGIALIALPTLEGWRYATLISPVFVFVLLTRISGVNLLEARSKKRWGEEQAYREYLARTSVLVPRPPSRAQISR